ncbi:putative NADPH-dependent oxidoreductase [Mycoplasmopsis californica]|uniref:Nitroreductase family protein n=1 Tax=Mycoplasmopsis equigenitalium TaxID=114883 RepID=A0ABY5J524_9BACT|nr:nitroreductase family protein [Mycoplasmopsis equigenitalium]UUD36981.1 nitroreductase family protein [Mycoplasmopsis equigenitalium]VEU69723.1 putative NADPH-dependent oxidoreductase [Mycoplasmopsis californica]
MKNFYDAVLERRRVRVYKNEPLTKDQENKIIEAINLAPSSSNWNVSSAVVVTDKKILKQLSDLAPFSTHLKTAPMLVVFLADNNRMNYAKAKHPKVAYNNHSSESYTTAIGDAFIQATMAQDMAISLGLGTCFLGLSRVLVEPINKLLNIKGQAFPVIMMSIGAPDENPKLTPKLNRVFNNKYDQTKLEKEVEAYAPVINEHVKSNGFNFDYFEKSVTSAANYPMQTEVIEKIWKLELKK